MCNSNEDDNVASWYDGSNGVSQCLVVKRRMTISLSSHRQGDEKASVSRQIFKYRYVIRKVARNRREKAAWYNVM
jgi:hypothetical protein